MQLLRDAGILRQREHDNEDQEVEAAEEEEEEEEDDEAGPLVVTGRLVGAAARQLLANSCGAVAGRGHGGGQGAAAGAVRAAVAGPVAPAAARVELIYPWSDLAPFPPAAQYQNARQVPFMYAPRR